MLALTLPAGPTRLPALLVPRCALQVLANVPSISSPQERGSELRDGGHTAGRALTFPGLAFSAQDNPPNFATFTLALRRNKPSKQATFGQTRQVDISHSCPCVVCLLQSIVYLYLSLECHPKLVRYSILFV